MATLTPAHLLMALAVMAVWGSNFVVIKYALVHLPPLTLGVLRFTAVVLPLVFFVKRPAASWGNLAAYGLLSISNYPEAMARLIFERASGFGMAVLSEFERFCGIRAALHVHRQSASMFLKYSGLGTK